MLCSIRSTQCVFKCNTCQNRQCNTIVSFMVPNIQNGVRSGLNNVHAVHHCSTTNMKNTPKLYHNPPAAVKLRCLLRESKLRDEDAPSYRHKCDKLFQQQKLNNFRSVYHRVPWQAEEVPSTLAYYLSITNKCTNLGKNWDLVLRM